MSLRFLAVLVVVISLRADDPLALSFTQNGAEAQRALEAEMLKTPDPERVREYIRVMSEDPHHTGSEAGDRVAEFVLEQFLSWGLDAELHHFEGLMPTPRSRRLELLEPEHYVARLEEPAIPEDKDSSDGGLPTYNAYSPDGDVTAQIVYVNYGMPDDYKKLEELGISVEGKIVLARYMGGWRGIKPKVAAEHGAIGCLIFSDPRDDGFFKGDAYPKGPFRPEWGVQRGSTMDMPTYPGDPQTPGWGAVPGARTLPLDEVKTLPTIPVLPIAWGDALPILRNLGGPVAPAEWRGSLPATYHVGAGPAKVRLALEFNWVRPTGSNVIARIEGSEFPDEWILYGNHHDAWVNGATDPVSGNAALMETARTLAERVRAGWRPKRTIIFASWDAEEWGLIGSTEWVEEHAGELSEKAVVYFNTDSNSQGVLGLQGSHTLERFLNDVARSVPDPRSGKTVWEEMKMKALEGADAERKDELESRPDLRVGALGSGSDYTAFLDHLGIASTNASFRGTGGGVYHSKYDSFDWYRRFGDPEFIYGRAMAQFHATAIARMADAHVLPFEFGNFADTVNRYVKELGEMEGEADLSALQPAADKLTEAAKTYEAALAEGFPRDTRKLNEILRKFERSLTHPDGLPNREWFKHHLYAPGFYTGYGVKTVPGVREAMEQQDWDLATAQAGRFVEILKDATSRIEAATRELH